MKYNAAVLLLAICANAYPSRADEPKAESPYLGLGIGQLLYPSTGGRVGSLNLLGGMSLSRRWGLDGTIQYRDETVLLDARLAYRPEILPGFAFGPKLGIGYSWGEANKPLIFEGGLSASYDFWISDHSTLGLEVFWMYQTDTVDREVLRSMGIPPAPNAYLGAMLQWKYFLK